MKKLLFSSFGAIAFALAYSTPANVISVLGFGDFPAKNISDITGKNGLGDDNVLAWLLAEINRNEFPNATTAQSDYIGGPVSRGDYLVLHYGSGRDGDPAGGLVALYFDADQASFNVPQDGSGPNGRGGLSFARLFDHGGEPRDPVPDAGTTLGLLSEEFNPWTGNTSPDGIWPENGVWIATGGNTFDPACCILTSSYPGETSSGFLTLRSLANSLNGAEIQTLPKYKYGYYETRLKVTGVGDPANNRGVVVSFFIADYDNSGWEVDIEFLTNGPWITSANSGQVTFSYHLPFNGGSTVHYQDLPFNPQNDFHRYGFLYQPGRLDWTVDGVIVYTVNNAGFTNPYGAFIIMNSWTGNQFWGGLAPAQDADSVYDWVKFYPDATSVPDSGSGQPDLIVTDVSWSPANPAPGNAVTFSATIKDQGAAATPSGVIDGVLFSVDGTPVTWSDNSTASLDAGATADTHTILANVDDVNRIAESNTPTHNTRVTLNWDQSPSPNITQNKIYRSTTGSGGPYLLLATISATTSYIDPGLTSGLEYFYVVTAVNSSGQESGISNYTSATPR